jgi:hypothetical protein
MGWKIEVRVQRSGLFILKTLLFVLSFAILDIMENRPKKPKHVFTTHPGRNPLSKSGSRSDGFTVRLPIEDQEHLATLSDNRSKAIRICINHHRDTTT